MDENGIERHEKHLYAPLLGYFACIQHMSKVIANKALYISFIFIYIPIYPLIY